MKIKSLGRPRRDEKQYGQRHGKWDIEEADLDVEMTSEYGGVVEDFGKPVNGVAERTRIKYRHQVLMVLVVTICIGFLMVVGRDIYVGAITLRIFIDCVVYILAAFGIVVGAKTYTK